jgi:hypothetical protein
MVTARLAGRPRPGPAISLPARTPSEGWATAAQEPQPASFSRTPDKAVSRSAATSPRTRPARTPAQAVSAAQTAYNNPAVPGDSERGPGGNQHKRPGSCAQPSPRGGVWTRALRPGLPSQNAKAPRLADGPPPHA